MTLLKPKAILGDFVDFNISAKMLYPLVKFDTKNDGDVGDPAGPTILQLRPNFL